MLISTDIQKINQLDAQRQYGHAVNYILSNGKASGFDCQSLFYLTKYGSLIANADLLHGVASEIIKVGDSNASQWRSSGREKFILMTGSQWSYFSVAELLPKLIPFNIFPVLSSGYYAPQPQKTETIHLDKESVVNFHYSGIPMWEVVKYNLCHQLSTPIHEMDLDNPDVLVALKSLYAEFISHIDFIEQMIQKLSPDALVAQHGVYAQQAAYRLCAAKHGINFIAWENTMRQDRILFEPLTGMTVHKHSAGQYYYKYEPLVNDEVASNYCKNYFENIQNVKQAVHLTPNQNASLPETDKKTVLYLSQVLFDASTLFDLPGFNSPIDVIAKTVETVIQSGNRIVIKIHPKENDTKDTNRPYMYRATAKRLLSHPDFAPYNNHPDVIIDEENIYNTYDLIRQSDICVTVNSQSGIEAAMLGKPVIICGHAYFKGLGFTHDCFDAEDLDYKLNRLLNHVDADKQEKVQKIAQKFFYIFMEKQCIPRDMKGFAQKINSLMKGKI